MAFNVNDSSKKVVGGGLWTGVTNVKVTMINPSKTEMEALGMKPQKDPEYLTTGDNNISKLRLDLYVKNNEVSTKVTFWLEDKVRHNKDGNKVEWINKYGASAWAADTTTPPNYEWFKTEGARPALVGEVKLTSFIRNWANVDLQSQAVLDNPSALAKGDLTEIKSLLGQIPNNEVQVLCYVNEAEKGNYQAIHDGYFDRPYNKDFSRWKKQLEKDGNECKGNYQNDLRFKQFEGSSSMQQDSPTNMDVSTPAPGAGTPYKF